MKLFRRKPKPLPDSWTNPYRDHPPIPARVSHSLVPFRSLLDMSDAEVIGRLMDTYAPNVKDKIHTEPPLRMISFESSESSPQVAILAED